MIKFCKELALGFASLFLLNLIVFYLIINPEVYQPYENVMENIESDNFIFSDSHGWFLTKNSHEAEMKLKKNNIKNLSYGSDSYFDIYIKLSYLIKQGITVDTIYLSADPHMLGKKRVSNNNKNRSIVYADFKTYKEIFKVSYPEFILRKYFRKHLSTFDVNNARLIQEFLNSILSNKNDFENEYKEWSALSEVQREKKAMAKFLNFYQQGSSVKLEKVLQKILNLAIEHNIVVIGLEYPVAQQMKSLKIPETIKLPRNIFIKQNLKVLSLTDIDNDMYFANQDHVNNEGADLIIERILKIKL